MESIDYELPWSLDYNTEDDEGPLNIPEFSGCIMSANGLIPCRDIANEETAQMIVDCINNKTELIEAINGLLGALRNGEFKTALPTSSIAAEMAEKVYRINLDKIESLIRGK